MHSVGDHSCKKLIKICHRASCLHDDRAQEADKRARIEVKSVRTCSLLVFRILLCGVMYS